MKMDLHIHTNTDCNLSCKHCYNKSGEGIIEKISSEKLTQYLQLFTSQYECDIHLEGGEIFLYPELFDTLYTLDDFILNTITITTNGTIVPVNDKVISVLKRINTLRISIEGYSQDIHAKIRNSTLNTVLVNGLQFKKLGINVVLRITLHQFNQDSIFGQGVIDLYHMGFDQIQVYEFQPIGRGAKHDFSITEDFDQILNRFSSIPVPINIKIMLPGKRVTDVIRYSNCNPNIKYRINNEENGLAIKANGDASLCAWNDEHIIANFSTMADLELLDFLSTNSLTHHCSHCSKIVVYRENI